MVGLCRLCASLRKINALVTIKDVSSEICEKLNKCCGVDINMCDALPKSICQECIENLNNSYKFYRKVKDAQETLQALYPSSCNRAENEKESMRSSTSLKKKQSVINQNTQKLDKVSYLLQRTKNNSNKTKAREDSTQKETTAEVICRDSNETPKNVKEESTTQNIENYFTDEEISTQQEQLFQKYHHPQNSVTSRNDDDLQSDEVIKHINDLITESKVDVEVEYVECYDEEEGDEISTSINIETYANVNDPIKHITALPACIEINSWKDYKYLCFICDDMSSTFVELKNHILQEHNILELYNFQYKCYDCKKIIPRYNFFLNHIRSTHHKELQLKCDACDSSCKNFEELSYHRTVNCAEAKNYTHVVPCSQCFKSFYNSFGLQNHCKLQHVPTKLRVKYKCTQCDKEFQYKSCLKSHQHLHTDAKKILCNYCDKSFYNKLSLEQHLYVHVNEKAFQCNICLKSYKTYQILVDHRKRHTDEKRFKCQFCDKRFSQKVEKLAHERRHTGEMPYSCKLCDKRFRYRSAQNAHSKIHTGYKPYSCEYCSKTFADSSNRNKHVKRMHLNGERYENIQK